MTSTLVVDGGSPLVGDIEVRGAKNLVSKAMVAVVLAEEPCRLRGVPEISDVQVVSGLLELHGVLIDSTDRDGELVMDPTNVEQAHIADIDAHAGSSRVPVLLCGPLLHRLGEAFIPDLGGCRIGERPINYHLDVLREFGAEIEKRKDGLRLTAPRGLTGADVRLPYPSVGATEQVLLTAVRARGEATEAELRGRAQAEIELYPKKEQKRVESEWNDRTRRARRRVETGMLDLGLQIVALWYADLAFLGWSAEDLVRNCDRLRELHEDAGIPPARLRQAVELVEETRQRFQLNVTEELACEALAYRLERAIAS